MDFTCPPSYICVTKEPSTPIFPGYPKIAHTSFSFIFADEPTGNLDSKTSYEIMDLFDQLHKKGNTIVMVTHEDDIAQYAHRIIRLRDGLIESDTINTNVRKVEKG